MALRRSARIGTRSPHCTICGPVPATRSHTLPSNVTSNKSGILLKAGKTPVFHTRQHSTDDLVETVTQYISGAMEERQQNAFDSFEEWEGPIDPAKSKTTLRKYFLIFDEMIFAGSLKPFTQVQFDSDIDPAKTLGQTVFTPNSLPHKPLVNISLATVLPAFDPEAPEEQGRAILPVLLHEMVHAFLLLFHCHCDNCLKESVRTLGITWHGDAWEALAIKISEFTSFMDDLEISEIRTGVQYEIAALREAALRLRLHQCPSSEN